MIVLPDNGGLSITSATRELAHAWHQRGNQDDTPNQERLSCDQRFFGFVAEWLQQGRTPLEDQMLQTFLRHVEGYRTDLLVDFLWAGVTQRQHKGPLVYWLPNKFGSHLFCEQDIHLIDDLEDKALCPLYKLTAEGVQLVVPTAKEWKKVWKV